MYHNPLGPEKAKELQNLLREGGCFVPSFAANDSYAIGTYVIQYAIHRTNVVFLLDRNIYSQVLSLAKGAVVNEKTRFAAGIMAFASCANATIEPGLALYEGAASGARGDWRSYRVEAMIRARQLSSALRSSPLQYQCSEDMESAAASLLPGLEPRSIQRAQHNASASSL